MFLNEEGICVFPGCEEDMIQFESNGVLRRSARCLECEEGFGMSRDWTCVACNQDDNPQWENCEECALDNNNAPYTCTVCADDKTLLPNGDLIPRFVCGDVPIEHCYY